MVWVVECIIALATIEFVLAIYCACVVAVMVLGFFAAKKHLRPLLFCVRAACRSLRWPILTPPCVREYSTFF